VNTASCIYEGTISHRRREPRHEFRHRLALAYVDLDELPTLLDGRLVSARPGAARFRRSDYLGEPRIPLADAVRDEVERQWGRRPLGPVRVLTQLRSFGHCFNPVSFYYCIDPRQEKIEALLAEVTNTPWRERHAYVVPNGSGGFAKALHVSPFMAMDHAYFCRASTPSATLGVAIESRRRDRPVFDATLSLRRRELTNASLQRTTIRYPFQTVRVLSLIYWHALRLKLAGAQVFAHPPEVAG
jgi:DUF1365 family protein